jgi:predicted RNA-binding protein (virulence factor B family)
MTHSDDQGLERLGEVAWLKIAEVNDIGAFADWGLPKDLFIPFAEQQYPLREGQYTLVKIYLDNQNRLAGSTRIDHWIVDDASDLVQGQEVTLMIADRTDMGFKAVINNRSWGLLYRNELFQDIRKGQVIQGYVKLIRDNDKVDLSLGKPGFDKKRIGSLGEQITEQLQANNGYLPLSDKSPPQDIYAAFGVSKKVFKQAIGALYKQQRISIEPGGIRLLDT